jgi:hypothetical protein
MARPRFLFVLFDGLRRDIVRLDTAPAIHGFRQSWTDFPNSTSVFPVETRVQVSSFVTGSFPGHAAQHGLGDTMRQGHGIMGNSFYDPALGFDGPMDTSDDKKMAEAARRYGRLQNSRNMGEILQEAGLTYGVVTTGKIGNARLLNLNAADHNQPVFSIWGHDISSPAADFNGVIERLGPVPEQKFPNVAVQDYAASVLLEEFIPTHDADIQVIWFNEPDLSFHYREIGSADSLAAVKAVDDAFRRILDWWHEQGRDDGWQIIAASDHGQITATRQINVAEELARAGFRVGLAIGADVDVVVKRSYAGGISIRDRDPAITETVFQWLIKQDWCGLVFSRDEMEGALPMSAINVSSERAPDLYMVLRTSDGANAHGYPGLCFADNSDIPPGGGIHGGLHQHEINNLLTAGGDLFRKEHSVETPTGLVDILPTMLAVLDVEAPASTTGRVLAEAFRSGSPAPFWKEMVIRAEHGDFAQELRVAQIEGVPNHYIRGGHRTA